MKGGVYIMATKDNPFKNMTTTRNNQQKNLISKATNKARGKGRPCIDESKGKKKDYCKTINIAVPEEVLEQVKDYALQGRRLNLTEYINLLIKNDLEKNFENYKKEMKRSYFD